MKVRESGKIISVILAVSIWAGLTSGQMVSESRKTVRAGDNDKLGLYEAEYEGELSRQLESKLSRLAGGQYFLVQVDAAMESEKGNDEFGGMTYDNSASLPGLPVSKSTEVQNADIHYYITSLDIQVFYDEDLDPIVMERVRKWMPYWLPTSNANLQYTPVSFNRELNYTEKLKLILMGIAGLILALLSLVGIFILLKMITKAFHSAIMEGGELGGRLSSESEEGGAGAGTPGTGEKGGSGESGGEGGAASASLEELAKRLDNNGKMNTGAGTPSGSGGKKGGRKTKVRPLNEKVFAFLYALSNDQIVTLLSGLSPQNIATVISSFHPERASTLFMALDSETRVLVAEFLSREKTISSEELLRLKEQLQERLRNRFIEPSEIKNGGDEFFDMVTSLLETNVLSDLVDNLKVRNPDLARKLRKKLFLFEDVLNLDDSNIKLIIQLMDLKVLAAALSDTTLEVRDKFMRNCSERVRDIIEEELEVNSDKPAKLVEEAKNEVVRVIRREAEIGRIKLPVMNEFPLHSR